jgi:cytochrome c oxidase subunit I+III
MIIFAFPAVILATMMLEIERSFGWPFFASERGGDALLWQHLFWFFGHPEVYIIFLPAAGLVSMIVPTMVRTPLVGYRLIVVALIATGFFSFGLWVHHMFTTGIPALSLSFFSAASMAVAIPSGIQFFSWIATIAAGRQRMRMTTASLFVLGFLLIFTLGGLTGVMVAMVPFDWQAHDTYFVVAHFHYVLIGGMVFPLFATFYYWAPLVSRNMLSERLGRWVFWLMFVGFNVSFLPMHLTGLLGMPRRVWTYPTEMGWGTLNMISTVGAFVLAAGVLLFVIDLLLRFRFGNRRHENPWDAGTLEWLPNDVYSTRSIPHVKSREPLWDQPKLSKEVEAGAHYLPNVPTGGRETLMTSPIEAQPQYVLRMPGPGWAHVLAAVLTAASFLLLTVKVVVPAIVCGVLAVVACLVWTWQLDPPPHNKRVDVGGGWKLPAYMSGPSSHAWWAMVVLMLVAGSLYLSYVFSYLYLWAVSPKVWPPLASISLPSGAWPLTSAIALVGSAVAIAFGDRLLPRPGARSAVVPLLLFATAALLTVSLIVEIASHWRSGLRPGESSYGALVYMSSVLNLQVIATAVIMCLFTLTRSLTGRLDAVRRVTFECTALMTYYAVGQGLFGLLLVHGFPRAVS